MTGRLIVTRGYFKIGNDMGYNDTIFNTFSYGKICPWHTKDLGFFLSRGSDFYLQENITIWYSRRKQKNLEISEKLDDLGYKY